MEMCFEMLVQMSSKLLMQPLRDASLLAAH